MLTDDDFRKIIPNLETIDPVCSIRRHAREIWRAEGSPDQIDIKALFSRAEADILGGDRNRAPTIRLKRLPEELAVDPELQMLAADDSNVLRSIIAEALKTRLNEHESICLAHLLRTNALVLKDNTRIEPQELSSIAALLADLSGEYSGDFLRQQKSADFRSTAKKARADYWTEMIGGIFERDEALTFNARHTIMRLASLLSSSRHVAEVSFQDY